MLPFGGKEEKGRGEGEACINERRSPPRVREATVAERRGDIIAWSAKAERGDSF